MERRRLIQKLFEVFSLAVILLLTGCKPKDEGKTFGNQERLWNLIRGEGSIEEPVEFPFTKNTPAIYRDASMGKVDPSFIPKVGGG